MRVGILTYHGVPNFGAQLQTLSTVCYLRNAGHEPIVLNWYPEDLTKIYRHIAPKQLNAHNEFMLKYLPVSSLCRTEEELLKEIEGLNLDAIFLGSDALFKYIPIKKRWFIKMGKYKPRLVSVNVPSVEKLQGNPFFGGFLSKLTKNIPASVYAVSAQNTQFEKMIGKEKHLMKSFMSNFNLISVRDVWTKQMVESVMGVSNINIFPDPVFAFNQNVGDLIPSREEVYEKFGIKSDYVLISFRTHICSDEYIQSIANEAKKNGLIPIALTMPEGVRGNAVEKVISIPLSPMYWYALIKYASGYIGERMHPIIVCLHNSVPCYVFDEYGCQDMSKVIFPRPIKFKNESSKIYHIMNEANMLGNWYSYASNESHPTPSEILKKILNFDSKRCEMFSNFQYSKYSEGVNQVLNSIINDN